MTDSVDDEAGADPAYVVSPHHHEVLIQTLESAHWLEYWVREKLVRELARDDWARGQLHELLLRLDFGRKVSMLDSWLNSQGEPDPELIRQLRALNDLRNVMSHSAPVEHNDPRTLIRGGRFGWSGAKIYKLDVDVIQATVSGGDAATAKLVRLIFGDDPARGGPD